MKRRRAFIKRRPKTSARNMKRRYDYFRRLYLATMARMRALYS